jgi:hypothetical protein
MSTTANGEVSVYYETFAADNDPVLLLVNGLGSQCINFKVELTLNQREAYRQAGLILALLHTAVPATADTRRRALTNRP